MCRVIVHKLECYEGEARGGLCVPCNIEHIGDKDGPWQST